MSGRSSDKTTMCGHLTARQVAIVVGGGIAGLAAASALVLADWQLTVLERAPAFGEVGAGLAATRNGMAALEVIGAAAQVRAAGHPAFVTGIQNRYGRWLMRVPRVGADSGSLNWVCGIHRQQLHAVLLRAADGIGSIIRTQLFPESRRVYSDKTCWRAVIEDRNRVDDSFVITYGPNTEFGALRVSDTHVYWYGYFPRLLAFRSTMSSSRRGNISPTGLRRCAPAWTQPPEHS